MSLQCYLLSLTAYLAFGLLHECFHLGSASLCGLFHVTFSKNVFLDMIFRRLLSLEVDLERKHSLFVREEEFLMILEKKYCIIRHFGWMLSVATAVFFHMKLSKKLERNKHKSSSDLWVYVVVAGYLTALDAVCTDLLGIKQLNFWADENEENHNNPFRKVFYCGNFGLILLHGAWLDKNGGRSALDILEKMIEVTMMRGAQSGGVITFQSKKDTKASGHDCKHEMIAYRTRVVKSKRSDLSKLLRTKMAKDVIYPTGNNMSLCSSKNRNEGSLSLTNHADCVMQGVDPYRVRFFAGHTRFATSSKATLDGTHPHRWSEPKELLFYDMDEKISYSSGQQHVESTAPNIRRRSKKVSPSSISSLSPRPVRVENYITHNGDFDFFTLNEHTYELGSIQKWLEIATETTMPTTVDSAAIAGMIDLIRCKGCFPLSIRYVICLGLKTSVIDDDESTVDLPSSNFYNALGEVFQDALSAFCDEHSISSLGTIHSNGNKERQSLATMVTKRLNGLENKSLLQEFAVYLAFSSEEIGGSLFHFSSSVIDAFFDNDLFNSVNIFMNGARGSFGLVVTSSLDAHRQICFAARGQSLSIAFYPQQRIVLFGSEQAAVKAGMDTPFPSDSYSNDVLYKSYLDVDNDVLRLDLKDLDGEICLLDWGRTQYKTPAVSSPNRSIHPHVFMNGKVYLYLSQEGQKGKSRPELLYHRMTKISRNPLISELKGKVEDPILRDIQNIPIICQEIQDNWQNSKRTSHFSLNRLTAWNLGRCLKKKLDERASSPENCNKVDIILTGCEVSLWIAEQFATDLQKAFPKLRVLALSSNKLLGLFGQEGINIPSVGFSSSERTLQCDDAIMFIVSHSGGTFAPLACCNLFQNNAQNVFVVTSEWDTQVGKQLRSVDNRERSISLELLFNSRIFTTGVGVTAAEPCSVSVVATHQLLTQIFQFISIIILSNDRHRAITGAIIGVQDLEILERCNRDNLFSLEEIVGADTDGEVFPSEMEQELRAAGDVWSEHILENAKAYVMSFIFIMVTVITGHLLVSSTVQNVLSDSSIISSFMFLLRFLDATIYFFLPQINVIILRLVQKRPLRHRMVSRSVVIGDIPWVAQAAEAFLSKIFACSYSIAGINVHSANPSDHFVHRMTHRVVRGTLLICGRPDGRLSALTAMENSVSLSINQASSIQSIGSTCESVTIGHNEFKLPLTKKGIFLKRHRPLFLCERLLEEASGQNNGMDVSKHSQHVVLLEEKPKGLLRGSQNQSFNDTSGRTFLDETLSGSGKGFYEREGMAPSKVLSSNALLGIYRSLETDSEGVSANSVLKSLLHEKKWSNNARFLFQALDVNNSAQLTSTEFVEGLLSLQSARSKKELTAIFNHMDTQRLGSISFDQFYQIMSMNRLEVDANIKPSIRDSEGLIQVKPSNERFFGESLIEEKSSKSEPISFSAGAMKSQNLVQELYESRIASMQRFVSMVVMFHQMGDRVEKFFSKNTLGLLGYPKDRSHSIMRIATTASPVSGADVRQRKRVISYVRKINRAVVVIEKAWLEYKRRELNSPKWRDISKNTIKLKNNLTKAVVSEFKGIMQHQN